ncbi:tRNA threonylcarbamoyladenosine biosynthesis protein TsaB [Corynebacterium capitovis DSM 44611]|uniref:tRNA (adenosine(37)-N6)-threonylcarbamoyltransferase complex dimerization subunit type 1 TsaB n=1 Tax=Corynebacterium capitovis TaxID=131081 RepID=UPI00038000B6|nr:tRNA (adenosine(37)-N6)-threonylcarbamoyltransferase complex dimerization subunit type 1 TsaB [Corynebacterium capitovis]WKD56920.1 tRNA threonylcarbamoyladenosine biosynthesis protein TsaB [Corynebacterium capitovis DSM 44611]
MIALALDTATTDLVAGVVDVGEEGAVTLAESVTPTRSHNELLVPAVSRILGEANVAFPDLDAIVVGCGPGPFTGLRVGMATASAFGQALGLPVHGVATHDAVASLVDARRTLVITDARRREVYWARYESGRRVAGPDVCAPALLAAQGPVDLVSVPEHLVDDVPAEAQRITYVAPRAAGLVAVADFSSEPGPLVPLYLRRPDAVEPKLGPPSPALPVQRAEQ